MSDIGHNSSVSADQLRSIIERVERLDEERKAIADDIKDVLAEAKGAGFNVKIIRKILAMRKQDSEKRATEEAELDLYLAALGMLAGTPLGDAALKARAA